VDPAAGATDSRAAGRPGPVELWSAVSLTDYPTITVTREPEDGNPASSGQIVLTNHP
jgi:hypothetical protein